MDIVGNPKRGQEIMEKLFGVEPKPSKTLETVSELTNDYLFGVIWDRPNLKLRDRSMITVAILAALGKEKNLEGHLRGALNLGITRDEIMEEMIHVAHYAGWASGMNGARLAEKVFSEIDATKP